MKEPHYDVTCNRCGVQILEGGTHEELEELLEEHPEYCKPRCK